MTDHKKTRPQAGDGSTKGTERYLLIRSAFRHAESAFDEGRFLEVISVVESILTDRLGSMVQGALGAEVTLRDTLGDLIRIAAKNKIVEPPPPALGLLPRGIRTPLPDDIIEFLNTRMKAWWMGRNHALHGMAKLHQEGDVPFNMRYAALEAVALEGIDVLLRFDHFDQREKYNNGAGWSATYPDALAHSARLALRLAEHRTNATLQVEAGQPALRDTIDSQPAQTH